MSSGSGSNSEEIWTGYWTSHELLMVWHSQTYARRCHDNQQLQAYVQHLSSPFNTTSHVVLDSTTCIQLQSRGTPAPSPLTVLEALANRNTYAVHLKYAASERLVTVYFPSSNAANVVRSFIESELSTIVGPSAQWRMLGAQSSPSRHCMLLPPDILQLKGLFVREMKATFRDPGSCVTGVLSIFGPVTVLADDDEDSMTVQFTGDGSQDRACQDAVACLQSLQPAMAVSFQTLFQLKSDAARQRIEDASVATLPVIEDRQPSGPPTHLRSLALCPYDGYCQEINKKEHQHKYLHRCTLPKPCEWRMHPRHAHFFVHEEADT
jgi:hypothetical protein